ncbi:hypothetical protein PENSPDRAFT_337009 [Peniophora sp. CONT]|nr:hypothetical protein PENSPDRAFT_337009 [Peniophora sp. CONT]
MDNAVIDAAREYNTLALIHRRLSNENLCAIFLALSLLDTPSLARPQGWFLQVNGICHFWREVALHYPELWARSAGSFPSRLMTDLAIQRAGVSVLGFNGHFEDHEGPGYVLTDYQLSLVGMHTARLRSLVHENYMNWSELFYCIRAFPELETARIWDDSGPEEWDECIDAPRLHCLSMDNAVIPFNAPCLRYLRVDMDNVHWRSRRDTFDTSEPIMEGCEAIPRVFPTREFIAFLQRSPGLERLIVTNMPLLLAKRLPTVFELHADLPHLRGLHIGGKSSAMGDFWQRLWVAPYTQVFIDTDYLDGEKELHAELQELVTDRLNSPIYDSLRLGMTPSYDFILQMWSSETRDASGLELSTSLDLTEPATVGPAFTLRLPVGTRSLLETFTDRPVISGNAHTPKWKRDPYLLFQQDMARDFFRHENTLLRFFKSSTLKHVDLAGIPFVEHVFLDSPNMTPQEMWLARIVSGSPGRIDAPDKLTMEHLFPQDPSQGESSPPLRNMVLNWTLIKRVLAGDRGDDVRGIGIMQYIPDSVQELTLVDFPCSSSPSWMRYDRDYNEEAWSLLLSILKRHSQCRSVGIPDLRERFLSLKLAESTSELSNMERSEEPQYEHTIQGLYEDAVTAVTERGYHRIAPFVSGFEDMRVNTWP